MVDAATVTAYLTGVLAIMAGIQAVALFLNVRQSRNLVVTTDKLSTNTSELVKATLQLELANEEFRENSDHAEVNVYRSFPLGREKAIFRALSESWSGKSYEIHVFARVSQGRGITGDEAQFELEPERLHRYLASGMCMNIVIGSVSTGSHRVELTMKCMDLKGTAYTFVDEGDIPNLTTATTSVS